MKLKRSSKFKRRSKSKRYPHRRLSKKQKGVEIKEKFKKKFKIFINSTTGKALIASGVSAITLIMIFKMIKPKEEALGQNLYKGFTRGIMKEANKDVKAVQHQANEQLGAFGWKKKSGEEGEFGKSAWTRMTEERDGKGMFHRNMGRPLNEYIPSIQPKIKREEPIINNEQGYWHSLTGTPFRESFGPKRHRKSRRKMRRKTKYKKRKK